MSILITIKNNIISGSCIYLGFHFYVRCIIYIDKYFDIHFIVNKKTIIYLVNMLKILNNMIIILIPFVILLYIYMVTITTKIKSLNNYTIQIEESNNNCSICLIDYKRGDDIRKLKCCQHE